MGKATFVQTGDIIDYTNTGSAVGYHDVVVVGSMIGIAREEIAQNAVGAVAIVGVHSFATDASDITVGSPVYYDSASGKITKEKGSGVFAGLAVAAASSGVIPVKINVGSEPAATGGVGG